MPTSKDREKPPTAKELSDAYYAPLNMAKGKPASPEVRFHQLQTQVFKLAAQLVELDSDDDLKRLLNETDTHRFSSYTLCIGMWHLAYLCKRIVDFMDNLNGREIDVVISDVPYDDPNRVQPVRKVWPLCDEAKSDIETTASEKIEQRGLTDGQIHQ